jgi:hypothetical protein
LLPGAELEDATAFAEAVQAVVAEQPVGDEHHMTVSLGVAASMRGQPIPYAELFKAADAAMYHAKEQERNRVCSASHSESVTSRPAQQGALAGATLSVSSPAAACGGTHPSCTYRNKC